MRSIKSTFFYETSFPHQRYVHCSVCYVHHSSMTQKLFFSAISRKSSSMWILPQEGLSMFYGLKIKICNANLCFKVRLRLTTSLNETFSLEEHFNEALWIQMENLDLFYLGISPKSGQVTYLFIRITRTRTAVFLY